MMDLSELSIFLVGAKIAGYASEKSEKWATPALDGSKQLEYSDGPYKYIDIYDHLSRKPTSFSRGRMSEIPQNRS